MLVLRRKIGQSLSIGEDIEVVVLSVSGRQVRLGAQAPKSVRIDRKEMREQRLAAEQKDDVENKEEVEVV